MKQWEKNNNIKPKDKKFYKKFNHKQHPARSQTSRRYGTTNNFNNISHSSFGRDNTQEFDPHNTGRKTKNRQDYLAKKALPIFAYFCLFSFILAYSCLFLSILIYPQIFTN